MKLNWNKILLVFVLFYVCFLILEHAYLFMKIQDMSSAKDVTAKVSASISLCYNRPPVLNNSCYMTENESTNFFCAINATDQDQNSNFVFSYTFLSGSQIFNVTPSGVINFTPNATHAGTYTFRVTLSDSSNCENDEDSEVYNLTILQVNSPPILIQAIPNQSWDQDTSLLAFDLDTFFFDPDGDPINYTYTILSSISVSIDASNAVTFTPITGFSGSENIVFFAWDPYYANASSNNVTLTVIETSSTPSEPEPSVSGGGGGGSSGRPGALTCIPRWYCRPWGPCEPDGFRRRECYDLNNCTSEFGKPNTTEICDFVSTCFDGFKGPGEEGIDCGGVCPPCQTCNDNICNNNEDCTKGLINFPDCGGPCVACQYIANATCFDNTCNGNEDCMLGITEIPDCGGSCETCPEIERPEAARQLVNWGLLVFLLISLLMTLYLLKKTYPYFKVLAKKRKKKIYEEHLMLETKISESIYDSLSKLEDVIDSERIEKLLLLFATIVRRYFKVLFDLDYEFTYEELMQEIESRNVSDTLKTVLKKFFDRSIELEFSGKEVSKEELRALISELKQIVSFTSSEPLLEKGQEKTRKRWLNKTDKMFVKISQAESNLRRGNINEAYSIYMKMLQEFKGLSEEDKKRMQSYISRLYEEIKLAREKY